MTRLATICQLLARVLGPIMLILGALFWTGNAYTLIPIHMLIGLLIVLILWILAATAALARTGLGLALLAALWGFVVPALGVTQSALLQGDLHWLVQLLHLAVGLVALALIERLARRIRLRPTRTPASPVARVPVPA